MKEFFQGVAALAALFVCIVWINCWFWVNLYHTEGGVNGCFCYTFKEYASWLSIGD